MKASDKRRKAKGRYFMSGSQMREAKWAEACLNSGSKRRGEKPKISAIQCGCGCGVICYHVESNRLFEPIDVKPKKKSKKEVIFEKG